jgi:intracellular multiplication protein IcmQ
MAQQDEDQKKREEDLIKAFDEVIKDERWERSLFFRNIRKGLSDTREYLKRELGLTQEMEVQPQHATQEIAAPTALPEGVIEIYISLYAAEGSNINRWETILGSLSAHSISRPIYKNEQDIKDIIRTKDYQQNDAYVAIRIHEAEILKPFNNKTPLDKAGRELLVIKEGAILPQNISRFVHFGSEYIYKGGRLIKVK